MANIRSWFSADYIIGNPKKFSLEERIFNTFCVIAVVALFLEIFFNYYIELKVVALICLFGTLFSAGLYYLSRIQRKTKLAIRSLGIVANFTFLLNYFFNSGIYGPNMVLFCLILLVTIVVVPKKELLGWVALNMITVFGVLIFEYLNPGAIPNVYVDNLAKTVDFGVTYAVAALLICLSIAFIRNNYDKERNIGIQKKAEIEEQNARIVSQNIELEKLNSEKSKMFSIVAHDIRSPLSSILGYLEVLAETDMTEEENYKIKQRLLQVTKDTSEMLSNVLAWSKSQLDGARVDIIAVDVARELAKGLNLEKSIAGKKNIAFELALKEGVVVAADLNMFLIVVRNLVNNAIKFTPEGGSVKVLMEVNHENCFVKVKDNGLGVSPQDQDNLFKLRAHSTFGTNNEKGVGLGLLLCKEFTELQDGKIWYEANEEKGSTFVVSFNLYGVVKGKEI
ncbi:sensor histidine kinase [Pedobacter nanyangensis]|uniref:sensor histidine kinase n=1 Tax=Pedobacter nanyangensis TaxID=1562389 RepID=UPI000DE32AE1|nr:HAMP domain-containing sensor histidine kinase [Pedobacter nanyangensis]